ncbi:hypothetical protein ACFSC6_01610 [Rufibacter sediminis]|uniref:Uncharacterized protein n=1 Tax=Rufibacter sediminis TaxID=2762756 RepID=A0ABR6VST7_9BACT|nr:hypothetical protein [Rufibacter sediminis]MBC3540206.1 hypothetical protein [Rufibacter sediminis]
MKILFTLILGALLGWASACFDPKGQLALERHQHLVERNDLYQTAAQEVEESKPAASIFYAWP